MINASPGDLAVEAMKVVHPGQGCEAGVANLTNPEPEPRMNIHKNARMTVHGRALLVSRIREEGWRVADAAAAAGVSERTAYTWLARLSGGRRAALQDRSSAPARCPHRLPAEQRRRDRAAAPPAHERAAHRPPARHAAFDRRRRAAPARPRPARAPSTPKPPVVRYERGAARRADPHRHQEARPDRRRRPPHHRRPHRPRNRGIGWEYLHVAIDDASRLAYTEILPDERKESACAFLAPGARLVRPPRRHRRAGHDRQRLGLSQPSPFASLLADAGLRHIRTRPYTPRTNGKAERFIQTSLREWAYALAYSTSDDRPDALIPWLKSYNTARTHSGIRHQTPFTKLNNLLGFNS